MAIVANFLILISSIPLFLIPAGESVRAMGWALFVFLIAAGSLVFIVPLGILCIFDEKPRFIGAVVVFLGIATIFLGGLLLSLASWIKGFEISD